MKPLSMRELGGVMICSACVAAQMSAMLPLLPIAIRDGTGSTARSGVVTGALALGTVFMELQTPRLLARWSVGSAFASGFLATGCALFGLSLLPSFPIMIGLGVLFGIGFGLNITVGSTVVGSLGALRGRNDALMFYAAATSIPMIITPPTALFALQYIHLSGVFRAGVVLAAAGLLCSLVAPYRELPPSPGFRVRTTIANGRVTSLLVAFTCVTFTYGGTVTLAPFVVHGRGLGSAAAFFLVFGIFRAVGRTASPALFHIVPANRLLLPGVVLSAFGLGCLAVGGLGFDLLAAVGFGAGFGIVQTVSFVAMLDQEHPAAAAPATALWNVAIDGGTGLGAVVLAPLAVAIGYRWTFVVIAAVALTACVVPSNE